MLTKDNSAELLNRLMVAIGKDSAGDAERAWFEDKFRALKQDYQNRLPGFESEVEHRELLRKFLANAQERRELRQQLTAIKYELWRVGRIRLNQIEDEESRLILGTLTDPDIIERAERAEEENVRLLLENTGDYRKRSLRKLAIEPFLVFLNNEEVAISRERPLNRMVHALLDFLGVDPKRRLTDPGIRTIAHDVKRDFEKRPAQHPTG